MTEPGTICIYGQTKIGKTSDVLYTFRDAYVIVTERDALAPVVHQFGYKPASVKMLGSDRPYEDMLAIIDSEVRPAVATGNHPAVVLDTGTALGSMLFRCLDKRYKSDGRKVYPKFDHQFRHILSELLLLPVWVIVLFHEQVPKSTESAYVRGGPKTGGSTALVEDIGGMFRLVMRAAAKLGSKGQMERMYLCNSIDPQWVQGDAYGVTGASQKMDLRPIMWRILNPGLDVPESLTAPKPYRQVQEENQVVL